MNLLGHTGWGYGRILGGAGGCFQVILDLRWEMPPRLDSSMICMVWRQDPKGSLSKFIWYCLREGCFCRGLFGAFWWLQLVECKLC
jgi:hypothetical protein